MSVQTDSFLTAVHKEADIPAFRLERERPVATPVIRSRSTSGDGSMRPTFLGSPHGDTSKEVASPTKPIEAEFGCTLFEAFNVRAARQEVLCMCACAYEGVSLGVSVCGCVCAQG